METAVGLGFINNLTTAYGVKGWNTTFAQAHPHTHLSEPMCTEKLIYVIQCSHMITENRTGCGDCFQEAVVISVTIT